MPTPGPLATPLSSSIKQKQRTPLPVYKITPNAANRLITPPKRQGYGFSYSSYGSPASSVGASGGGLGGGSNSSLLGGTLRGNGSMYGRGSLGRSFGRSVSTSNLRKSLDPDADSILTPGALSANSVRASSNLKRLTIDRSLRSDLFSRPAVGSPAGTLTDGSDHGKKRVSFDAQAPTEIGDGSNAVAVRPEETSEPPEPTPQELGFLRSVRKDAGATNNDNGSSAKPATQQLSSEVSYPDLRSVETDGATRTTRSAAISAAQQPVLPFTPGPDPSPGEYWMVPSRAEVGKMSREQLKRVSHFTVGRQFCGRVIFDQPVDLTTVDLDKILGTIVVINVRSIAVYPDGVVKPPVGKGLNVPSTLKIENSWPRGRDKKSPSPFTSGPLFEKHVDRLRKVNNTEFVAYEKVTGTWVFRVPHFTTYGFDYDSDEDAEGESINHSKLDDTPQPSHDRTMDSQVTATYSTNDSFVSSTAGINDDTFDFKRRKMVPGAFGIQGAMDVENNDQGEAQDDDFDQESFLEQGSTGSTTEEESEDVESHDDGGGGNDTSAVESGEDEEMEMAGSFPNFRQTVEQQDDDDDDTAMLNKSTVSKLPWDRTPPKAPLDLTGDWGEHLQRTISPRKQNRDALREIQASAFGDRPLHNDDDKRKSISQQQQQKKFSTSIDLMNSLFHNPRKQTAQAKGFVV